MEVYAILRRGGWRSGAEQAIRRHASLAELPVDEIVPIADTVIVHPDPEPAVHS